MILDTDVIVAAIRSTKGASAEIVRRVLRGEMHIELTVAMALEYEAVAMRAEHLRAGELTAADAMTVIDALAALATPIEIHFRWRPQLRDTDDEMILEAAINAHDRTIVTFNTRDFVGATERFGVSLVSPREILEKRK
ncbi:putative toxin-antitoxin system toxin component, PIN family [Sphingorhabdus sp.]|jgi:predicted nucleic acid-binding protein|uniref:putative toxin-antitoxin system toxin component, PIN family n=1 Tax=Sphingorhabdus sp. TaxID=1902408 RepID=UPI0037C90F2D